MGGRRDKSLLNDSFKSTNKTTKHLVTKFGNSIVSQENIAGLQVPMNDATGMYVDEGRADLPYGAADLRFS